MASNTGNTGPTQLVQRRAAKLDPIAEPLTMFQILERISGYPVSITDAIVRHVCNRRDPITGYELLVITKRAVERSLNGK